MSSTVLKGSAVLAIADFSRKVLLAVTVLMCARFLSPSTFGEYIFLLSFYQIFSVLGGAGIPSSLVRVVAMEGEVTAGLAVSSLIARMVYIVPSTVVMYGAMVVLGYSDKYLPALGLLCLMMVTRGAAENIGYIFQGIEDRISSAQIGVIQSFITLAVTLVVCITSKTLLMLVAAHVMGGLAGAIYGFLRLAAKHGRINRIHSVRRQTRMLLSQSHWLNLGTFVASAYNRVDVVMLKRFVTSAAIAVYGAPYRAFDLTQIIPSSLVSTILPGLCRKQDGGGLADPKTAMRILLVVALVISVMVTVAGPLITVLLFGNKYEASIPVLRILIWATIPMFWNFVLTSQLIANSFDKGIVQAAGVALVVNFGLNLLLIPHYGYFACAGVTLVTECVLLLTNIYLVSKIGAKAMPEHLIRILAAIVFSSGFALCWCYNAQRYSWIELAFLVCAATSLPIFRSDFHRSTPATVGARVTPVLR